MSRWLIALLLLTGTVLQTAVKPQGLFGSLEIPALNAMMIYIALHADFRRILYAAALAGFLHDSFCPAPLGLAVPFFMMLAVGVNRIRYNIFGDLVITYVLLGLAAAVFETAYYAIVFSLTGLRPVSFGLLAMRLAGGLLAGATIVPLIAVTVFRLCAWIRLRRRRFV
ncbi:MAG: hypothetical protein MUC65_04880 [Pontiellaceae bacterium]|jgi:rod shape-determining protein MreD|nr:hypothetical protein [Pontiellaceae bacterium]